MSKPAQLSELDEAKRVLGMVESVSNPQEYLDLFNISAEDLENYKNIVDKAGRIEQPKFQD